MFDFGLHRTETSIVKPFVEVVLNFENYRHVCLKLSAIRFLGGMANWLNKHPDENLEKSLHVLVSSLPTPECSNASAVALQVIRVYTGFLECINVCHFV